MKRCKYIMDLPAVSDKPERKLCGAYYESEWQDGLSWGHFPECHCSACPVLHPELLDGAVLK